jgi:hypothetical protein
VYAAIRQGKAKTGMAEELARRIKEGAIPIISDVEGFMAYYVVYAPDDTVTAISIFNDYAGAEESNRRVLAWIEQSLTPLLAGPDLRTERRICRIWILRDIFDESVSRKLPISDVRSVGSHFNRAHHRRVPAAPARP